MRPARACGRCSAACGGGACYTFRSPFLARPHVSKLLVFLLVLFAIYWGRRLLRQAKTPRPPRGAARQASQAGEAERILSCARCGLLVPESEGVQRGDAFYCCDEHARGGGG